VYVFPRTGTSPYRSERCDPAWVTIAASSAASIE
jgi:hypothetical protein